MSFDMCAPAICAWNFKGEQLVLFFNLVKQLLSFKVKRFIHVLGVVTGPILSLATGDMCSYHVPWILDVVSNDPDAGTPFAYVCCFCQLSICVGSHSICRS